MMGFCFITPQKKYRGDSFHVDHCHKTDKVRGLLCGPCNIMLGLAKDNEMLLANAILYLEKQEL
jgi:hypothetical protein